MAATATQRTVEAVWRIESPRLIAGLARVVRDVGLAEDLAQDALVVALETWPRTGVPGNPGAWLMTTARHRAIDTLRRGATLDRKREQIARELETQEAPDVDAALDDDIGDGLLRLVFTACHPVVPTEGRIALTLRILGGLTTSEIARAFLVGETTLAQRITRAKRTLAEAGVPFEAPSGVERVERLGSVLEVVYLIFNEGYAATAGDDWMRLELCEDALRLGRILAQILPEEGEVHGLVALMEIQQSRARSRVGDDGEPVLLADQDRSRWDRLLITRGLAALASAAELGGLGPYGLQAAIAACHARARSTEDTDWAQIAQLYGALADAAPSPVVELNRAVAISMADGPAAGLAALDALAGAPALRVYHLLPAVRGDVLERLGRVGEARTEFARAAGLTRNARERELLLARTRPEGQAPARTRPEGQAPARTRPEWQAP
jgi:RNA polymerase sigma-70 factor (ECF subfamily)